MSITYKPTEPLEVGIGESMPAEFIKEAERSRARTVSLTDEIERLKTDNAKLRELVEDMLDCIDIQIAFGRVPARWMQDEFAGRARELGIEVGE